MTNPQLVDAWLKVIDEAKNNDPEELLNALSAYFDIDAKEANHPLVKSILEELSEDMAIASLAYYASTK